MTDIAWNRSEPCNHDKTLAEINPQEVFRWCADGGGGFGSQTAVPPLPDRILQEESLIRRPKWPRSSYTLQNLSMRFLTLAFPPLVVRAGRT